MEDLNQNVTAVAHSQKSTQNGPKPNEEKMAVLPWLTTTGDNNAAPEGAGVEASPEPIAEEASVAAGSRQVVKRGRPRKPDVDKRQLYRAITPPPGFVVQPFEGGNGIKRGRGRPRGSGRLQILASIGGLVAETTGTGFTPRVVTVNAGEDMVSKITSCYQRGPMSVCIVSATGLVSSVTIREPGSTNTSSYEGRFEIVSLTGSYAFSTGAEGAHTKSLLLSVSLAKRNGQLFGGNIESSLIAAGPIQLILATFKQKITNQTKKRRSSDSSNALSISAFELGLKPGGLNSNLSRKPVETMAHLRERVQGYIREEQSDQIKNNRPNAAVPGQKQQFEAKKGAKEIDKLVKAGCVKQLEGRSNSDEAGTSVRRTEDGKEIESDGQDRQSDGKAKGRIHSIFGGFRGGGMTNSAHKS
ncbi:AT-hook motif nuclear-localized protein 9-like [Lotus japonicus]|uniref:AT-hook motif nuclear-localized protein 9-like n=1 Tax=Lotus japonicus TaxID=34305 RepID=UPI00258DA0F4|nr:AT-hook motif nuclear-localized protein 9-like [Lotus japonicus]